MAMLAVFLPSTSPKKIGVNLVLRIATLGKKDLELAPVTVDSPNVDLEIRFNANPAQPDTPQLGGQLSARYVPRVTILQ